MQCDYLKTYACLKFKVRAEWVLKDKTLKCVFLIYHPSILDSDYVSLKFKLLMN